MSHGEADRNIRRSISRLPFSEVKKIVERVLTAEQSKVVKSTKVVGVGIL
jgi:hypothetical protein